MTLRALLSHSDITRLDFCALRKLVISTNVLRHSFNHCLDKTFGFRIFERKFNRRKYRSLICTPEMSDLQRTCPFGDAFVKEF